MSRSSASRLGTAPPRQRDVLSQFLGAVDHPRRQRGGEPHALLLVELGVLERREPLDLVQQRRGRPPFSTKSRWARTARTALGSGSVTRRTRGRPRRAASPGFRRLLVVRLRLARTPRTWPTPASLLARCSPRPRRSIRRRPPGSPLVVRRGCKPFVDKDGVPCCAARAGAAARSGCRSLPAASCPGWGTADRRSPCQLVAPRHGLGDEVAAHPAGRDSGHRLAKKNQTWAPFPERDRSTAAGTPSLRGRSPRRRGRRPSRRPCRSPPPGTSTSRLRAWGRPP